MPWNCEFTGLIPGIQADTSGDPPLRCRSSRTSTQRPDSPALRFGQRRVIATQDGSGPGGQDRDGRSRAQSPEGESKCSVRGRWPWTDSTVLALGPTDNHVAEWMGLSQGWTVIGGPADIAAAGD